tara:strand:- start:692 stop:1225 length:534 start_codon:yes stop_codon:yes gene_type:complete
MIPEINRATVHIPAVVVSGRAIASRIMASGNDTFKVKNIRFVPGTLNLVAKKPIVFNSNSSEAAQKVRTYFFPVYLNGTLCWVRRYPQCPLHVFEVVSDVQLRETLNLEDGAVVQLEVAANAIKQIGILKKMLWYLPWKGREFWFYRFAWYPKFISRFLNARYRAQEALGFVQTLTK